MDMLALKAAGWGGLAGSALLVGAVIGYYGRISPFLVATVMAFGSGVLISTLSFDLMDEAYARGGFSSVAVGFMAGALAYTAANVVLSRYGGRHRKRSNGSQTTESQQSGSGLAIALGALMDGIPESIAIGISMIAGGKVSLVMVAAIFLSNVPEGLSSSAGMKRANRSKAYIFGVWGSIAAASAIAAWAGCALFSGFSPSVIAATTAVAAGAILAMLADTMMPEAFEQAHQATGLVSVGGFLLAFMLTKLTAGG